MAVAHIVKAKVKFNWKSKPTFFSLTVGTKKKADTVIQQSVCQDTETGKNLGLSLEHHLDISITPIAALGKTHK